MAKFFVPILKKFTINEYTVKDSFFEEISEQNDFYVVSFDVESFFTNVTLDQTAKICAERVFKEQKKVKSLLKRHFIKLLTFTTKSSFFIFNGVYYCQIDASVSQGEVVK